MGELSTTINSALTAIVGVVLNFFFIVFLVFIVLDNKRRQLFKRYKEYERHDNTHIDRWKSILDRYNGIKNKYFVFMNGKDWDTFCKRYESKILKDNYEKIVEKVNAYRNSESEIKEGRKGLFFNFLKKKRIALPTRNRKEICEVDSFTEKSRDLLFFRFSFIGGFRRAGLIISVGILSFLFILTIVGLYRNEGAISCFKHYLLPSILIGVLCGGVIIFFLYKEYYDSIDVFFYVVFSVIIIGLLTLLVDIVRCVFEFRQEVWIFLQSNFDVYMAIKLSVVTIIACILPEMVEKIKLVMSDIKEWENSISIFSEEREELTREMLEDNGMIDNEFIKVLCENVDCLIDNVQQALSDKKEYNKTTEEYFREIYITYKQLESIFSRNYGDDYYRGFNNIKATIREFENEV